MINVMEMLGVIFIIFGIASVVNPKAVIKLKVWSAKEIAGAKLVPSKKTEQFFRILGVVLTIVGFLVYTY